MEPKNTIEVIAKPWYQSRTILLNLLGLIVLVLTVVVDNAKLIDLSVEQVGGLGMVLLIANAVLRLVTNQPVASGPDRIVEVPASRVRTTQIDAPPKPGTELPRFRG